MSFASVFAGVGVGVVVDAGVGGGADANAGSDAGVGAGAGAGATGDKCEHFSAKPNPTSGAHFKYPAME